MAQLQVIKNSDRCFWRILETAGTGGFIQFLSSPPPLLSQSQQLLIDEKKMPSSAYENVVIGKLKLKGDPLSVKGGDISKTLKKTKRKKKTIFSRSLFTGSNTATGEETDINEVEDGTGRSGSTPEDRLTAAERRYLQQRERIERERLRKMARKSHRDRIQEFNQYLANLSEHYDIPKVGPG